MLVAICVVVELKGSELLTRSPPFNMSMSQFYPPPILTTFPPCLSEAYLPVPEHQDQVELARLLHTRVRDLIY
jgi:hypothetical protein